LNLAQHITAIMEMDDMLPAVAQGAVAIEVNTANTAARKLVEAIHDKNSGLAVQCERALLAGLEGSCRTPIAGHASVEGTRVSLKAQALTLDGRESFEHAVAGPAKDVVAMGLEAAAKIKEQGGEKLRFA
jgi:hydroxymethylbilane synthase